VTVVTVQGEDSQTTSGDAVFNATGIRIRDLPIHPEDLLREP
jgi:xanthine dehydrogenase YagR molybdenum-binding subunit